MTLDAAAAAELVEGLAERGMVIGGDRSSAGGAGAYEHHNPTTGAVQATVPLAGADEVDAAVPAARAALPGWRDMPLPERMAALHRLADLLAARAREAGAINALDNGTPISAMDSGGYAALFVRYYAGWVDKLEGEVVPVHGGRRVRLRGARALRRDRRHRPVERPDDGHGPEVRAGAGRRQHGGGQAAGDRAVRRDRASPSSPSRRACRRAS